MPVSYHGAYPYHSGSTKQELKRAPLHNFFLSKVGLAWDRHPGAGATLGDIDEQIIKFFVQKASLQPSGAFVQTPLSHLIRR